MASDPFIGEISIVAFSFPPAGWAFCDGSLLLRNSPDYAPLFSLIGTSYGAGDGQATFALPDLRGRLPLGTGQGPGLSAIAAGEQRGFERSPLTADNLPSHTHQASFQSAGVRPTAYSGGASLTNPTGAVPANPVGEGGVTLPAFSPAAQANAGLAPLPVEGLVTVLPTGSGQPLNVCNPALGLNFIIAFKGIYPSRAG